MPRAKARPERPRVRSGSACGVFRLSVRRVCPAGVSGGDDGPTVFVWERSGCRFGRQLRLGSSVGFVVGAVVGPAGCPAGRPVARSCLFWGGPAGTQQKTAGGLAGPCWKRVWLSVPCVALGPVFGACRERPALRGAFVPVPASGCLRPAACVRLPGRGYCSSSVIETLTCSLTKSPASSDAASRGTNSSSVKPIRYSRALYEPFWGPSMSVKFSVRLSF